MKDLTEAQLIEMEKRADALEQWLEADSDDLRLYKLRDRYDTAYGLSIKVAQDVELLCEHVRAQVTK